MAFLARSRRLMMGGRHPLQDMMQASPPLGWPQRNADDCGVSCMSGKHKLLSPCLDVELTYEAEANIVGSVPCRSVKSLYVKVEAISRLYMFAYVGPNSGEMNRKLPNV